MATVNIIKFIRAKFGGQQLFDSLAWSISISIGVSSRYDFQFLNIEVFPIIVFSFIAVILQLSFGQVFHLYRGRYRIATLEELKALALTSASVGIIISFVILPFGTSFHIPRGTMLLALPLFLCLSGGVRALRRSIQNPQIDDKSRKRALIYGAGSLAETLIPQLQTDQKSQYQPVGLMDDNPEKKNRWISKVPMMGNWSQFKEIVLKSGAQVLIVCISRADSKFMTEVESQARKLNLEVLVFPSLEIQLKEQNNVALLRSLSIEDLIGRRTIDTQVEDISSYLNGKSVLVTGAGGSIGSELCRQISRFSPAKIVMLDRDETGLQLAQIGVFGHGLLDTNDIVLADIREAEVISEIFKKDKPDVVFHAAALKHLPVLEQYPDEAWKTNVLGTLNVLNAAKEAGTSTFINISTDKAADPTSVLGKSKRVAEGLTSWFAEQEKGNFLSVRFGNVLGSRGSLLPTFSSLIERGGPLTVTDPEATRFFMSIPEACQLVLQAGAIGRPQDVLILDMGEPVRILDIANRMIEISGKNIEIIFTGLRPGEKLHEDLYAESEESTVLFHPLISHAKVPAIPPLGLEAHRFSQPNLPNNQ